MTVPRGWRTTTLRRFRRVWSAHPSRSVTIAAIDYRETKALCWLGIHVWRWWHCVRKKDTPKENRVHLVCDKNTDALRCERRQKPSL